MLQTADSSGWIDLYGFIPEPVPQIDVETSNWFTSTHPRSPFVTGLIVTKLDGSARGGVLVALAEKYGLPVHLIGVGESLEDMRPFEAESFARSLMGLEN